MALSAQQYTSIPTTYILHIPELEMSTHAYHALVAESQAAAKLKSASHVLLREGVSDVKIDICGACAEQLLTENPLS